MRIRLRHRVAAAVVALATAACGPGVETAASSDTWVGTVTTGGDVTTVVNESGSLWGGDVELEEILSIGVESGAEPYLLGEVSAIGVDADHIYVVDRQLSVVRVYDHAGAHRFDVGREGRGPGELMSPSTIAIDPAGRLLIQDSARVNVFGPDGSFIETWPYDGGAFPIVVTADGTAFVPWRWPDGDERRDGMVAVSPDGSAGKRVAPEPFDDEPWRLRARRTGQSATGLVSHAPQPVLGVLPSGAIVEGVSGTYCFEIEYPDGRRTFVERDIALPVVPGAEREWLTKLWTKRMRTVQPDWRWNANPVPGHRPAFDRFSGDRYGRIWVRRVLRTEDVPDCDEDPSAGTDLTPRRCWRDVYGFDLFDEETGRYLGGFELPARLSYNAWPAFVDDGLLVAVQDEAGTIMVKRYRLVLPGKE